MACSIIPSSGIRFRSSRRRPRRARPRGARKSLAGRDRPSRLPHGSLRRERGLTGLLGYRPPLHSWAKFWDQFRVLEDFFSAPHFHSCIRQRGSLALSFGHYLEAMAQQVRARERPLGPHRSPGAGDCPRPSSANHGGPAVVGQRRLHRNDVLRCSRSRRHPRALPGHPRAARALR